MSKLSIIPIIDFSKEDESFRSKLFDFMIENSIDFDRDIIFDQSNSKNGATFNAMVRIFNIKKNSLIPQKKLPQHIRASIYQNLVSRPIDEELRERIKLRNSQSPKPKPKAKPKPKENTLKVPEPPKQVRAIRNSIYSHLVKFSPPKVEKDFEEINKAYKTPQKKAKRDLSTSLSFERKANQRNSKRDKENLKNSSQSKSKSTEKYEKNQHAPVKIKEISRNEQENVIKRLDVKNTRGTSPKTEPKFTKNKDQNLNAQFKVQSTITTMKKDKNAKERQNTRTSNQSNKDKTNNKNKSVQKANVNTDNSYSFEVPSLSVSAMNRMYEDLLNKTYEFNKKNDLSYQAGTSDEELKELCDKIKTKSGFRYSQKLGQKSEHGEESESFKKTMPFLEESQNRNISFDESNEMNKNPVDNKELVEKLDNALKILESQKGAPKKNQKSLECKLDEEFVKVIRKNSGDLGKNPSSEVLNKNFEKIVDKFLIGLEFLSTQELLYYYKFILDRAKTLYLKFLKTRGMMN